MKEALTRKTRRLGHLEVDLLPAQTYPADILLMVAFEFILFIANIDSSYSSQYPSLNRDGVLNNLTSLAYQPSSIIDVPHTTFKMHPKNSIILL